jgi:hypothetical protein
MGKGSQLSYHSQLNDSLTIAQAFSEEQEFGNSYGMTGDCFQDFSCRLVGRLAELNAAEK